MLQSKIITEFENFTESWWPYVISFIVSVISAIRIYVGWSRCESSGRIDGKNVIVTGTSGGIGLETTKELSKRGGNIILAIQNADRGAKIIEEIRKCNKNANVVVKLLDMSEFSNIRDFAHQILDEYDKVDILINNAGLIINTQRRTSEGNELTFVTNYLGPFLLTHLLLPALHKSDNGRVINVSANAHMLAKLDIDDLNNERCLSEKDAYAESKLALTMFTRHMAQLCKDTNITFNSVSPGMVRDAALGAKCFPSGSSSLARIYTWPWKWLFLKSPKQGCQTIVYLAVEPTLHKVSGYYFSDCEIKDPSDVVNDENLAKALYEKSCKIVDIQPENIILPMLHSDDNDVNQKEQK